MSLSAHYPYGKWSLFNEYLFDGTVQFIFVSRKVLLKKYIP